MVQSVIPLYIQNLMHVISPVSRALIFKQPCWYAVQSGVMCGVVRCNSTLNLDVEPFHAGRSYFALVCPA